MISKKKNIGRCKDCAYHMTAKCFYSRFWQDCYVGIGLKRKQEKRQKEAKKNDTRSKV